MTPPLADVAKGTITDVNGKIWYSSLQVASNFIATGACILNGSTVATDKWILAIYDSTGTLLTSTALAGTTTANASKYQCIAFNAPIGVTGPAQYFIALQGNGTTDTFQAYAANGAPSSYPTGSQTGTFGTLAAITSIPTTFTAAVGPVMTLY
jgi:hypothetical protein